MRGRRGNLAGRIFGNLTVLELKRRDNRGRIVWMTRCNCGAEGWKRADYLLGGQVKSCGTAGHKWAGEVEAVPDALAY